VDTGSVNSRRRQTRLHALTVAATAALLLALAAGGRAQTNPAGRAAESGRVVYLKAGCQSCHGTVGQGGSAVRLAPNPIPRGTFINWVRNGKRNPRSSPFWSGMPAFSSKFISDSELGDLYEYLAAVAAPPPARSIPALNP
jgi:mono/diheme cytochrome c family protein